MPVCWVPVFAIVGILTGCNNQLPQCPVLLDSSNANNMLKLIPNNQDKSYSVILTCGSGKPTLVGKLNSCLSVQADAAVIQGFFVPCKGPSFSTPTPPGNNLAAWGSAGAIPISTTSGPSMNPQKHTSGEQLRVTSSPEPPVSEAVPTELVPQREIMETRATQVTSPPVVTSAVVSSQSTEPSFLHSTESTSTSTAPPILSTQTPVGTTDSTLSTVPSSSESTFTTTVSSLRAKESTSTTTTVSSLPANTEATGTTVNDPVAPGVSGLSDSTDSPR